MINPGDTGDSQESRRFTEKILLRDGSNDGDFERFGSSHLAAESLGLSMVPYISSRFQFTRQSTVPLAIVLMGIMASLKFCNAMSRSMSGETSWCHPLTWKIVWLGVAACCCRWCEAHAKMQMRRTSVDAYVAALKVAVAHTHS